MILLDDVNLISSFAEYLKYGLSGLSAIVLILTYFLLYKEQSRESRARENILVSIRKYMWTALIFLIISGTWSILEQIFKPNVSNDCNNCFKTFALELTIQPDSTMNQIDAKDSLILMYREKKTEPKWRIASVDKGIGENFIASLDSLKSDEIYQVKLCNVSKSIVWENLKEISVTSNSASLFLRKK